MRVRPLDVPAWDLARVSEALPGSTVAGDATVTGISLSTRDVVAGDLFAALPGATTHGVRFAARALEAGAVAVLTDPEGAEALPADVPRVVADQPRARLAAFSADFYGHPSTRFTTIGVTGTQGKTTTTYLAEAALGEDHAAVIGTIGTRIAGRPAASSLTTPEAPALQALFAVMAEEQVAACAMEVSSHAIVQGRVDGFVLDAAVFLNLGRDHLDFHHDVESYFQAKAELFTPEHARRAVINIDDAHGRRLTEMTSLPVTTFSTEGAAADWRALNIRAHRLGSDVTLLAPDGRETELSVPLPGAFNVSNAVAAVVALAGEGHDLQRLADGIATARGVPGRMERVEEGQSFTAIVDYAHKPEAVEAVLHALRPVTAGRLIVVLGAGGDRDRGKRPLMGEVAARLADVLVVTDDNPRSEDPATIRAEVLAGAAGSAARVLEIGDRREAIAAAVDLARTGDTVVVAGKGHERGQQVGDVVHPFDDREVLAELIGDVR
ncbi:UDP-N-acetylmuramoyl-L-alanyl-D-glutamate--2,6-diaminopimelate ligase [Aeromicrobium duanguangcaii]|uniref:UDP-N-acetylmuramoyl-L-alanyl-D-glutamate--2,6-diaminopimelate ligase n=1 Tax=Aeromicrobium duanguangcaii TaxID=2968086 RepID=A0ABY5KGP1_9ACTN|nr:UDP-N-acetylmuramoyl-L-alanyl-D-glutamate--2,6-diaminopimelate ligase [Aeromicrobium duanguangcaii]MCD9153261.1 UDP-N-acetylmuramoyl-L-alanyl-D-glutamate--2,6-diaminopimelate ligase [Aeromicrobium duanguangcaii]UUI69642.1 UDP-N-acetylmuramoyl-L-alanyl-D-glutamate--2,6-diaminopimelate ligase [Aeromicrobium duanguangcaii]